MAIYGWAVAMAADQTKSFTELEMIRTVLSSAGAVIDRRTLWQ